jgi:hypothetical protein
MKLYLAGPMSGIPQFNYPLFLDGAEYMRNHGFDVYCPAEMDSPEAQKAALASETGSFAELRAGGCEETWGDFLREDVKIIADDVDGVVLLPGWAKSRGARLEAFVCINVKKPLWFLFPIDGEFEMFPMVEAEVLDLILKHTQDQGDTSRYEG